MILFAANHPLVRNGTYDREGYKPGERARIAKARARHPDTAGDNPVTSKPIPLTIGQPIRYKPGTGTYGYEDDLEADGRLPGIVIGWTLRGRVQVELTLTKRRGQTVRRTVAPASIEPARSTSHNPSELPEPSEGLRTDG